MKKPFYLWDFQANCIYRHFPPLATAIFQSKSLEWIFTIDHKMGKLDTDIEFAVLICLSSEKQSRSIAQHFITIKSLRRGLWPTLSWCSSESNHFHLSISEQKAFWFNFPFNVLKLHVIRIKDDWKVVEWNALYAERRWLDKHSVAIKQFNDLAPLNFGHIALLIFTLFAAQSRGGIKKRPFTQL